MQKQSFLFFRDLTWPPSDKDLFRLLVVWPHLTKRMFWNNREVDSLKKSDGVVMFGGR